MSYFEGVVLVLMAAILFIGLQVRTIGEVIIDILSEEEEEYEIEHPDYEIELPDEE